jgi:L-seryl-tRNA(Ser) seleniumtransferase
MDAPRVRPPAIDVLLRDAEGRRLSEQYGRTRVKAALRDAAGRLRRGELAAEGAEAARTALLADVRRALEKRPAPGPRPVLNATGVLLHTNLGRAPLADAALAAVIDAGGYCTLEYDSFAGTRGRRGEHVRPLLVALFAPGRPEADALAVTNAAAGLLLALDTAANGRPVAVSRGELVAIGGDFRVPSILARSGASLAEVGTTNRTTEDDYREALDAGAAAILKVRPSNYRIVGFTGETALPALAALAAEYRVPLLFDAGAGVPGRLAGPGLSEEPVPADALDAGADLVCFSGDKLLGGPQAGLLVGRRDLVERCARNPLARALRPDKLVLAALAATLDLHLAGRRSEIPLYRMLEASVEELERRAESLVSSARAACLAADVVPSLAVAGGGAGAESTLPSRAVALRHRRLSAEDLAAALRRRPFPIVSRIEEGRVLLDLRSVAPEDDEALAAAFGELEA